MNKMKHRYMRQNSHFLSSMLSQLKSIRPESSSFMLFFQTLRTPSQVHYNLYSSVSGRYLWFVPRQQLFTSRSICGLIQCTQLPKRWVQWSHLIGGKWEAFLFGPVKTVYWFLCNATVFERTRRFYFETESFWLRKNFRVTAILQVTPLNVMNYSN